MKKIGLLIGFIFFIFQIKTAFACMPATKDEKYFGVLTGFPSDEITSIIADEKGNIYVGTEDKGVLIISAKNERLSKVITQEQQLTFNAVHSLAIGNKNVLWIGTAGGLNAIRLDWFSQPNRRIFAEDGLKDNICLSLSAAPNGNELWIGTSKGVVQKSNFKRFTTDDGLIDNFIQSLFYDVDNNLWIGTSKGLMKRSGFTLKKIELTPNNPSLEHWIYSLAMCSPKAIDFVKKTKIGFTSIIRGLEKRIPAMKSVYGEVWNEVIIDLIERETKKVNSDISHGQLYVATNNGCFSIDRSSDAIVSLQKGWFTAIAANSYGGVVAADKELVIHPIGIEEEVLKPLDLKPRIIRNILSILEEYKNLPREKKEELLPITTLKFLEQIEGNSYEDYLTFAEKLLAGKIVSSLCFSPQGHLWVGVKGGGIFRFKPLVINHDTFAYAIMNYNAYSGLDQKSSSDKPRKEKTGLSLSTPAPECPQISEIILGIDYCKKVLPKTNNWWVGKWSQLNKDDCDKLGEFAGSWAEPSCLIKLVRVLRFDPYIIVPLEN